MTSLSHYLLSVTSRTRYYLAVVLLIISTIWLPRPPVSVPFLCHVCESVECLLSRRRPVHGQSVRTAVCCVFVKPLDGCWILIPWTAASSFAMPRLNTHPGNISRGAGQAVFVQVWSPVMLIAEAVVVHARDCSLQISVDFTVDAWLCRSRVSWQHFETPRPESGLSFRYKS